MAQDKEQGSTGNVERGDFTPEVGGPEQETDYLFRAQMAAYNFFAGYWRQLLGVLGVFLALALAWSLYLDWHQQQQQEIHAQIATIERDLPPVDPMAGLMGPATLDEAQRTALTSAAQQLEALARQSSGPGAVMAYLRAADAYQRAQQAPQAIDALKQAHQAGAAGILGWSATAQLAGALRDAGQHSEAQALYQQAAQGSDIVAQQATLELASLFEATGQIDQARQTLQDFTTRFPSSQLKPQAEEALGRLQG